MMICIGLINLIIQIGHVNTVFQRYYYKILRYPLHIYIIEYLLHMMNMLFFKFNEVKISLYAQCIVNKDNRLYRLYLNVLQHSLPFKI